VNLRKNQSGYMIEIPIIATVFMIILILVMPTLMKYPKLGKSIMVLGAIIISACLYYIIVIPGWQPFGRKRFRWPFNIIVFGILELLIVFVVIGILLK
jgi:hypothetical protein